VVLSSNRLFIFFEYSSLSSITVAFPLSAGRITIPSSFLKSFKAARCAYDRLDFGTLLDASALLTPALSWSPMTGSRHLAVASVAVMMSEIGILLGVRAKFMPSASTCSSIGDRGLLLRMMTSLDMSRDG